ncbi:MAG TPA: membrane protein insertion efficiency factor YidD [Stellaceae bacterium]|nr:membrane protein insertion efficiency factor YidD [Stellaceae bacterium]
MERQRRAGITSVALSAAVRGYQLLVSPLLPPSCRFLPSCSEYAVEAIERHGARRGAVLALRRLTRCHPWGGSGYDPVPKPGGLDRPRADLGR